MKSISTKELKSILESRANIQVIDVRTKEEWQEFRIDSDKVINIDVNQLISNLQKIDANKEIYVICASGGRSGMAQLMLSAKGIEAINVAGGMYDWISNGFQTIS